VTSVSRIVKWLTLSTLAVGVFLTASARMTGAQTVIHGAVVNRDGQPQAQCKVEFRTSPNSEPEQVVYTDASGQFTLTNPQYTTYSVLVRQGGRTYQINSVVVAQSGITPNPLVVDW
jgi:Carboxypeptidase regulatory-like domain